MQKFHKHKKLVLVAALDWGLGHASRMIPVINSLLEMGFKVDLASDNQAFRLLENEFPNLSIFHLPSYQIRYSKSNYLMLRLIAQVPKMVYGTFMEHKWLKQYVHNNQPDLIISDNRFGLFHRNVKSVYVTHQINVIMPQGLKPIENLVRRIHRSIIMKYSLCLVPDFEKDGISGDLSHSSKKFPFKIEYLGVLSRFNSDNLIRTEDIPDVLIVISGPEPQRSILENKLTDVYRNSSKTVWMVLGKPGEKNHFVNNNIHKISHLPKEKMAYLMKNAPILIMRSGYTSLMDLFVLGRKSILVPTPGQTEQEYLAKFYDSHFGFKIVLQSEIKSEENFLAQNCTDWNTENSQNELMLMQRLNKIVG
jgi:uncharacterized protein (TIGR00661 family)